MRRKLLVSLAPLVAVVAFVAVPAVAQAVTPHYFLNSTNPAIGKIPVEAKDKVISYGKLALTPEVEGTPVPTECENAVSGYVENPAGEGAGKTVTESFTSFECTNTECSTAGGHIGVIFENEGGAGPGLRNQISWPSELTNAVPGTIRLKASNVAVYVHCQFAYTPPTEKPGSGPFTGLEERNTAEYNGGVKVTCTTKLPGVQEPKQNPGTKVANPGTTEFDAGSGKLECGLFKGVTSKKLYTLEYNKASGQPALVNALEG